MAWGLLASFGAGAVAWGAWITMQVTSIDYPWLEDETLVMTLIEQRREEVKELKSVVQANTLALQEIRVELALARKHRKFSHE